MRLKLPGTLIVATVISALISSTGWTKTPSDTLVIARNISDYISLDPQEAFEISSGDTLNNLYLRLVQHDPMDFRKIIPGAAESWEASADGKQITFKI